MFHFLKKNREAVKKYLLIFFLGIVSLSMVVVMAPLPAATRATPQGNVLASIGGENITSASWTRRFATGSRVRRWASTIA